MSGTFPSSPGFQALDFRSVKFNVSSESISGRTFSRGMGGQRYEFTVRHDTISRANWLPVQAFLEAQEGSKETFQIVLPVYSTQPGNAAGTIQASAAGAIGDTSLAVDGFLSGTLKAGGFVKWSGHSKVYQVLADRAGDGTLSFFPPLVEAVADNETLVYSAVPFTVRLDGDTQEFSTNKASRVSYEQGMVEAI